MKRYSDLDIYGKLTLRGKFNDQLTTDGGFYSKSFGELAYKSDLGSEVAAADTKFYGISVKTTDGVQRFNNINVIAFNVDDFYAHKQDSLDDEVMVTLEGAVRHVETSGAFVENDSVDRLRWVEYVRHVIPPNYLSRGKACRISTYGQWSPSINSMEFYVNAMLDNEVLFKSPTGLVLGSSTNGGYRMQFILTQPHANKLFFQFDTFSTNDDQTATVGDMGAAGDGNISLTHTFSSENLVTSDSTAARTLRIRTRWEDDTGVPFTNKYFQTVEYL